MNTSRFSYSDPRTTDIAIMEESDAKDTNAFIDEFQRRKRNRIAMILGAGVMVVGIAAAVILLSGGGNHESSQSSSIGNTPVPTSAGPVSISGGTTTGTTGSTGNEGTQTNSNDISTKTPGDGTNNAGENS
ncbi:hypothetical protein THRCLA_23184, partial [Thraustotheca clavata]